MSFASDIYRRFRKLASPSDLPAQARIWIYGPDLAGKHLVRLLRLKRPDVKILGFVDSFSTGAEMELPKILPGELAGKDFDLLVVTLLSHLGAVAKALASLPEEKIRMNLVSNLGYHGETESAPVAGKEREIETVARALGDEDDRVLWRHLVHAMKHDSIAPLVDWYIAHPHPELHYLEHYRLREGDVVLEGGVFDGNTTCRFADRVGERGHVYAFDPLGEKYATKAFTKHAALKKRFEVHPFAIADKKGEVFFEENKASSKIAASGNRIHTIALDDFVTEKGLKKVDFIKMDVEGTEPQALDGARTTIARFRPVLAISIYHGTKQFLGIPYRLVSTLKDYEFHLGCYTVQGFETVFYAIPKERSESGEPAHRAV